MSARVYVALPVLDEVDRLPACLDCLVSQTHRSFELWACVNQPESWWHDPDRIEICERNQECLRLLRDEDHFPVRVLDRSSRGFGWEERKHGVGWARRTLMDGIASEADPESLIVSIDADAVYADTYLEQVRAAFEENHEIVGLAAPYLHPLTGIDAIDRAMLRYEIYLRMYALNLWRIKSPYAFTAMGSLISTRVRCYRAVGGMEPKRGGEDFYFLQKLCKYGSVLHWLDVDVQPATRMSNRVPVGTGPALAMDPETLGKRYPIYPMELFDDVRATMDLFEDLYAGDLKTPLTEFLEKQLKSDDLWGPMRRNYRECDRFVHACHERLDGLRILQYLKAAMERQNLRDEECITQFLEQVFPADQDRPAWALEAGWRFRDTGLQSLETLRQYLKSKEDAFRRAGVS